LHGNILRSRCSEECGVKTAEDPECDVPLCACGAPLRPDVVWFGEMLPPAVLEEAFDEARNADVCLIAGTSGVVHPAASLPNLAHARGAVLIEVNPESTPLTSLCDWFLRGPSADCLPFLVDLLRPEREPRVGGGV